MALAKGRSLATFLVGHVTKDGSLAGPRVLEHLVDTVLNFEGERHQAFRMLRASKNRFGGTQELGIFEMNEAGLQEVNQASEFFLRQRAQGGPGSAVVMAMEGTRPAAGRGPGPGDPGPFRQPPARQHGRRSLSPERPLRRPREAHRPGALSSRRLCGRGRRPAPERARLRPGGRRRRGLLPEGQAPVPSDWVLCGEVGLGGRTAARAPQSEARVREAAALWAQARAAWPWRIPSPWSAWLSWACRSTL